MVPIVEYRKVVLRLPNGQVLSDLDFTVQRGELCLIIGENGSGKTSLLRSMYFELPIVGGTARILDADILALSAKDTIALRRRMGLVFEYPELFEDKTVYTNCATVLRAVGWKDHPRIEERVHRVLRDLRLADKSRWIVADLSAGEKQRLTMARALVHQPELLIADTPFACFDRFWEHHILQYLAELCQKKQMSAVLTTRQANLAELFDGKKYLLSAGALLPYGRGEG